MSCFDKIETSLHISRGEVFALTSEAYEDALSALAFSPSGNYGFHWCFFWVDASLRGRVQSFIVLSSYCRGFYLDWVPNALSLALNHATNQMASFCAISAGAAISNALNDAEGYRKGLLRILPFPTMSGFLRGPHETCITCCTIHSRGLRLNRSCLEYLPRPLATSLSDGPTSKSISSSDVIPTPSLVDASASAALVACRWLVSCATTVSAAEVPACSAAKPSL